MSRHSLAMAKDFPQLLRLRIEIISGTSLPSSFRRPAGGESQMWPGVQCTVQCNNVTKLKARLETKGDLCDSIRQLLLDQLVGSERTTLRQDKTWETDWTKGECWSHQTVSCPSHSSGSSPHRTPRPPGSPRLSRSERYWDRRMGLWTPLHQVRGSPQEPPRPQQR